MPTPTAGSRQLHERLRQMGQRLTPQRMLILDLLHDCGGHVTADDIYSLAHEVYPYLNISTVYRTLELFRDLGLLAETDLGDGKRHFALLSDVRHHHLVCLTCNAVQEVSDELLTTLRDTLTAQYGFHARIDHLAIFGQCAACVTATEGNDEAATR